MTLRSNAQAHPFVTPMGRHGLRGKTAIDMREREWDGFVALRQGGGQFWWFLAPCCKREVLIDGGVVRRNVRDGKPVVCPACKRP